MEVFSRARPPTCLPHAAACPPHVKLAGDGKHPLRIAARGLLPREVVQRRKWYFPVPALSEPSQPVRDLVREALHAPEAKERGLFRPAHVERLLAEPARTPLNASKLWQLGVLELWLQLHGMK